MNRLIEGLMRWMLMLWYGTDSKRAKEIEHEIDMLFVSFDPGDFDY